MDFKSDLSSLNPEVQQRIFEMYAAPVADVKNCTQEEAIAKFIPVMENIAGWLKNLNMSSVTSIIRDKPRDKLEDLRSKVNTLAKASLNMTSPSSHYESWLNRDVHSKIVKLTRLAAAVLTGSAFIHEPPSHPVTQFDNKPSKTTPIGNFNSTELRSFNLDDQKKIFDAITAPVADIENDTQEEALEKYNSVMEDTIVWLKNFDKRRGDSELPINIKSKFHTLIDRVNDKAFEAKSELTGDYKPMLNKEIYDKIKNWTKQAESVVKQKSTQPLSVTLVEQSDVTSIKTTPIGNFNSTELRSFNRDDQKRIFDALTAPVADIENGTQEEAMEKCIPVMEEIIVWLKNFAPSNFDLPTNPKAKFYTLIANVKNKAWDSKSAVSEASDYKPKLNQEIYNKIKTWAEQIESTVTQLGKKS